jgi:branched-chain amino acid transport system substrate-binding protein
MRLNRRFVNVGLAASLAAPAFSRVARADGDTIKIGMVLPVTGPAADFGKYELTGAKIALDRVNKSGGALGKQVELVTEDDLTTNPGAVLAFSKLAAQPDIVAFIGSYRSTANRDGARYPEDGQTRLLRRHRSQADEDGQSLADPLPAQ